MGAFGMPPETDIERGERIVRLETQYEALYRLGKETRDEVKELTKQLDGGCQYGRSVERDLNVLVIRVEKLETRLMAIERTVEHWKGSNVVLVALGMLVIQAIIAHFVK